MIGSALVLVAIAAGPSSAPSLGCEAGVARVLESTDTDRAAATARASLEADQTWDGLVFEARDDLRAPGESTRVGVTAAIPVWGLRDARRIAGGFEVEAAEAEGRAARVRLAATVRLRYVELARVEALVEVASAELADATRASEEMARRLEAGVVDVLDARTFRLRVERARLRLDAGRVLAADLKANLTVWTGGRPDADEACATAWAQPDKHPSVVAATARGMAAGAWVEAARRAGWLWPSALELAWDAQAGDTDRILLGVRVPMPWPGAGAAAQKAAVRAAERRVEASAVGKDTARAQGRATRARRRARRLVQGLAAQAGAYQEAVALAGRAELAGGDPVRVLRSRQEAHRWRRELIEAEYGLRRARVLEAQAFGVVSPQE